MPSYWSWEAFIHLFRYISNIYMLAQFCIGTPTPQIQMKAIRRPSCRVLAQTKRHYTKSPWGMLSITRSQSSVTASIHFLWTNLEAQWPTKTISCIRGSTNPPRGWTTSRSTSVFVVFSFIVSLQSFHCCVVNASQVFCIFIFPAYNPH